jgi:hypothetical protein
MANVHSMAKVGRGHNQAMPLLRRPKKSSGGMKVAPHELTDRGQHATHRPIKLSGPMRTFLASERDVLIKVEAVLRCSATAMESNHPLNGSYYPDAIQLAANLIRHRVIHLDDLLIDGTLPVADR